VQSPLNTHRLGRYPTILLSLLGLAIFGFGTAFVNSFHQYLFFRFVVSQAVVGYIIGSLSLGETGSQGQVGWEEGHRAGSRGGGCWAGLPQAK
jgi:MFS family permease